MIPKKNFKKIIGSKYVIDDPQQLQDYASDNSYVSSRRPELVVRPRKSEEIQEIVKLARQKNLKLVPVSSGPPRFRGDTVPATDGAVVVDLSRMNRINWINRRNRVAVVEPGVTFDQLQQELDKVGLRSMFPLLPRGNKSVVGAFMEREPFTVPKYAWDLGDPVASSELVLGDGYCMRTGGGAGPGKTLEDQRKVGGAQKSPLSPLTMDVRRIAQGSQGSYAICTWLSLRCELLPELEKVFFVGAENLDKLIEISYRLMYLRLPDEMYILNSLNFACLLEKNPSRISALQEKLPPWILVTSIGGYGELPAEQFNYKNADVQKEVEKWGMSLEEKIGGIRGSFYRDKVLRKTSEDPYWKTRFKGDCREVFFLTSLSRTPEFIETAQQAAYENGHDPASIGVYLQLVMQGTGCHCEFDLYTSLAKAPGMEGFFNDLSQRIFNLGGYYSRPYGVWSELVYPYSDTFVKYARGLKDIFDPGNVMNPGKLCFKEN